MTTKEEIEQLKQAIAKAEQAKASLEAKLEAERRDEYGNSFYGVPMPREEYYFFGYKPINRLGASRSRAEEQPSAGYRDKDACEGMAEAINILMELQGCKGVEEKACYKDQWIIKIANHRVLAESVYSILKNSYISPAFDTEENCQAAIDRIGVDKLTKMFKGFGFVGCTKGLSGPIGHVGKRGPQ